MPHSRFAQAPAHYEPTLESLDQHPLPQWYAGAKLGIFIHWGLYSVPGWAPINHPDHDFSSNDYIKYNPYAEWYLNVLRIPGSPQRSIRRSTLAMRATTTSRRPSIANRRSGIPIRWPRSSRTPAHATSCSPSKHHEGFTLWPSTTPNPTPSLKPSQLHAERDIVGELTSAVQKQGMKMGLYYSGGYDWTFNTGPIETDKDYETVKPQIQGLRRLCLRADSRAHRPLQARVLWNDIDWPKTGNALQVEADYYNAIPDGVIDDRFGIKHSDFTSPEYEKKDKISAKKWEECRGLGRSFGYNRAEGEKETIAPGELIALLVDIVSKNGNLCST